MQKILVSLFALLVMASPVCAATYSASSRVPAVGEQILSKNGLPAKTTFNVSDAAFDNSNVSATNVINVAASNLTYAGNDNEVAAVIANEVGHIINGHASRNKFRDIAKNAIVGNAKSDSVLAIASNSEYVANRTSLKDNKEADITGVDLMINAGYNPLAMIVVITKMPGSTLDILQGKPANAERAMNVYDYLTYNYPSKVSVGYNCQEYRNFLAYANPIVKERNASKSKLAKFNKQQLKNKKLREKQIAKYKTTGGVTGWDASYAILQGLASGGETSNK